MKRPSDGITSEALPFEYLPLDSGRRSIWQMRKSLKEKTNFDLFNHLLVEEKVAAAAANAAAAVSTSNGIVDDVVNRSAFANVPIKKIQEIAIIDLDTPTEDEKPPDDHQMIIKKQNSIEQQTVPSVDEQMDIVTIDTTSSLANDKTTEWIRNTEFKQQLSEEIITTNNNDTNNSMQCKDENTTDDDKTLNELLEQVAELDEIYTDHQLLKNNASIEHELNGLDHALPKFTDDTQAMDFDDLFDDTATYTSLQIAFKNPVPILDLVPPSPPANNFDFQNYSAHYDAVEPMLIVNPPAPIIDVSQPLKRESPKLDDERLPPLPPKRCKKTALENNENQPILNNNIQLIENLSRNNSIKSLTHRPPSQIIIMKTPEQSPINKRLPPAPPNHSSAADDASATGSSTSTLSKPVKKPGFFSKLFSRKKSKPDINSNTSSPSKNPSTDNSREPSLKHFDSNDTNRASTRSIKSLHIPATSSNKKLGTGKPVGRSVSSVSGKRPQITADIIHIPLKGDSEGCIPLRSGSGTLLTIPDSESYERASTATLTNNLDRKTVSALQLADLPLTEGNMNLIAIADRQSLRNLCEGEFGVQLDPNIDLTEAEHYALYTSVAPHATESEFDESSCYYAPVETGEILTQSEVAKRLAASSFT